MDRLLTRVSVIAARIAGVGLLLMALLGVADIIATQFLKSPIPGVVEITRGMMVFCIMLGLALAESDGKHIRVEIGLERLPARLRHYLNALAPISMAVLFALIAWFGWHAFWQSVVSKQYDQGSLQLPLWPARLALATGATLVALQALVRIARVLRQPTGRDGEQPLAPL